VAHHDVEAQKAILRATRFADAGWECRAITEAMDATGDVYFDDVVRFGRIDGGGGRVALVGDACFAPSLLSGQRSALGMAGVYILAGELGAWRADHLLALRRCDARFKWSPAIARVARLTTRAKAILVTPHAPSSTTPVYAPSEC
jgi:2-polyprenyl-6-methoxyphenol hydroxylase-like FAD-dependent oxidoreductase